MSIVKSLSVGDGDMFYIKHNTDSFTMIDCCMLEDTREYILQELKAQSAGKGITRLISTHPDDDHIAGLVELDDAMTLRNFYCVHNEATKPDDTPDFQRYCLLRDDPNKAFKLEKGCSRKWLNESDEARSGAGIHFLWPIVSNERYKAELKQAKEGKSFNNISCVLSYSLNGGATLVWMGDLETDFMEGIKGAVSMGRAHILFAPHHGRRSGKVPARWLDQIQPSMVVIGEAPSKDLDYYSGYNTITQNSAWDMTFECVAGKVHVYVLNKDYSVDFLDDEGLPNNYGGKYIGTLATSPAP